MALSVAAVAATAVRHHLWPWTLGAMVADHLLLTGIGLWPRSTLLGSNWTRLPSGAAASGAALEQKPAHDGNVVVARDGRAAGRAMRARMDDGTIQRNAIDADIDE